MTPTGELPLRLRRVARVLLISADEQVLLVRYGDDLTATPPRPSFGVPPGGALQVGESFRDAAVRELLEETGISLERVGPHVWTRELRLPSGGVLVDQHEEVFLAPHPEASPVGAGDALEGITEVRWWPISLLLASSEVFFPANLPVLARALADGTIPDAPIMLAE